VKERFSSDAEIRPWNMSEAHVSVVGSYAAALYSSGFRSSTQRQRVHTAAHLVRWIEREGLELQQLDDGLLERFRSHLGECTCERSKSGVHEHTAIGATRFVEHLRATGVLQRHVGGPDAGTVLIDRLVRWLKLHRGVSDSTATGYRSVVSAVVDDLGPDPSRYDVASMRRFVLAHVRQYGTSYAKAVARHLRGFLRFLVSEGLCKTELVEAVPRIAHWTLAEVPRHLTPESVEKVLVAPSAHSKSGLRTRAILLLLARLGLRARDIIALRLVDLDWERGLVRVLGKGRRETWLPLPQDAGDAVLEYLEHARPASSHPHLFLRVRAPFCPLKSNGSVSLVVRSSLASAGVERPTRTTTHLFRHSLARRLLAHDVPLEGVGVVLRHRSLETSAKYAKIDVAALETVVQPWPEGSAGTPC
jgi:site-specific recombinase XerD